MGSCLEAIFCNSFQKCFRKAMLRAFVSTYSGLIKRKYLVKEIVRKESRLKSNVFPKEYCSESDFFLGYLILMEMAR